MTDTAPRGQTVTERLGAQIAATAVAGTVIAEAPFDALVTAASFTPDGAITGASATKRTFTLVNRGQDGSGATVIGTLDFVTGVNGVAGDEKAFTLSAVAHATEVAAGDILAVAEAVTSTGTANPGGMAEIVLQSR